MRTLLHYKVVTRKDTFTMAGGGGGDIFGSRGKNTNPKVLTSKTIINDGLTLP